MQTLIDVDELTLACLQTMAQQHGTTLSEEASRLLQQALQDQAASAAQAPLAGFAPFPANGRVVTNALVDALREQECV